MVIQTKLFGQKLFKISLLQCLALLLVFKASTQTTIATEYPQNFFRNPLGIPIQLAANFGELRNNHFHMGLDIRTNQRENLPVYAAGDGYISRIKIEQYGFGRAIYITHPNGFTTLYAHLNDFYPALNEYIKSLQYSTESWAQDLYIDSNLFPVTKGQFIAYSGNTGGSAGPHLHFEIRETYTENNLNPLLFNLPVTDNIAPFFSRLFMYDRRYSTYQTSPQAIPIKKTGDTHSTTASVVITGSPAVSFGISAGDKTNGSLNLGIYQAQLYLDDVLQTAFTLNDFSYPESRYINASTDYPYRAKGGPWLQFISQLPGNKSPIFSGEAGNGIINLADSLTHTITVVVKDVNGNKATLRFKLRYDGKKAKKYAANPNAIKVLPNRANNLQFDNATASFGPAAFYDTLNFVYATRPAVNPMAASYIHSLHNFTIPVHDSFTVRIKPNKEIPVALREKVVMHLVSNRKQETLKGLWVNEWVESRFRDLGDFQLLIDTVAPTLSTVGWASGTNLKAKTSITLLAKDNLGELTNFRAELDGNWLMFSRKNNNFIHKFDERTASGPHILTVTVADQAGNETQKSFNFSR